MQTRTSILAFALIVLSGCGTSQKEIRTERDRGSLHPQPTDAWIEDCHSGRQTDPPSGDGKYSIENYGKYLIGFAEFDDQGWNSGTADEKGQVQVLMGKMEDMSKEGNNILVLVFVHGWHHNAHDNDCNVRQFRTMVKEVSERYSPNPPTGVPWKVVGVYVGWRGESIDVPVARLATIYTRKITAEHIAKGSVRELFARLKLFETKHRKAPSVPKTPPAPPDPTVRTVVVGHSFGGLIAFHSLSQSLLEDIVFGNIECEKEEKDRASATSMTAETKVPVNTLSESAARESSAMEPPKESPWAFPDLTILINPAFEASRYEALFQATQLSKGCKWGSRKRPRMITLAADNDTATGTFFPYARRIATIFEAYNETHANDERKANHNVIGFVDRYRTHNLKLCKGKDGIVQVVMTAEVKEPPLLADPYSPLVVARAPQEILDGHDGFLYSPTSKKRNGYLLPFITKLYVEGQDKVMNTICDGEAK